MLPFIIAGLTTGSVYALAGVGLVLTYKTSGVFNFAHGALATIGAYSFYTLHVQSGLPWPIAACISVFLIGPTVGVAFERIGRTISRDSLALRVACTVGILLMIQALAVIIYGAGATTVRTVPHFLGTHQFRIGSTILPMDRIVVFVLGVVATAGLYSLFRLTRVGVAMRAVVDNADLLDIGGTNPIAVRRWAWIIGVTFASASGVLLSPFILLDSATLTFLVIAAFGAAAIGAFNSLPWTYVGGLAIGVLSSLSTKYFVSGLWGGLSTSLPFLVLFFVLLVAPRRWLTEGAPVVPRGQSTWTAPWQVQSCLLAGALLLLASIPSFAGLHLADYTSFLALAIMFLSLGLLVRTSGQVSLCHVSFMAIGACAFSHISADYGLPWAISLLFAGLFAVPIGALLAIPAIRMSGLYLALSTFGFGILLQYMFYPQSYMFNTLGLGVKVSTPRFRLIGLTGSGRSYYYFVLAILVVCAAVVVAINKSRLGRLLRALADSPTGLATTGTSVSVTRVLVFCISAFLASIAGVLQAGAFGNVDSGSYQPITSLTYFVLIILSAGGVPWYALLAAAGTAIAPSYLTNADTNNWLQVIFGLGVVAYAITPPAHRGMPPVLRARIDGLFRRREGGGVLVEASPQMPNRRESSIIPGSLQVKDLRVTFGGLVAVDGLDLEAPTGRITGLIGPNGAGKTTTFNACSGLVRPNRGRVLLDGIDVSRMGSASRARHGLGRTFQQMELFDSVDVRQNIALGLEGSRAGLNGLQHLASSPSFKRQVNAATDDALRLCGLLHLASASAGSLSTGQRRLVELARCLAGPFRILLLDEPSSGLDRSETAEFGNVLRQSVENRGLGILLVEHDMALVTQVCEYIYVLDFGRLIFEGTPAEVMSSPVVQAAYLGGEQTLQGVPDCGGSIAAHEISQ